MDVVLVHPFLHQKGGAERLVLEVAKKFNPIIYTIVYQPENTFPEFRELDVRILPQSVFEKPFFLLKSDLRRSGAVSAGLRYYFTKLKDDYDVINASGTPSEWIRNRNPRVCWYCHSPNREAFDLYSVRAKELSFPRRVVNDALLTGYKAIEFQVVPKIEKIITNSEVTKEKIRKYLHRDDAEVVYSGVDEKEFVNSGYEKYFFYPSRITPEKRFEYAIEAFRLFSQKKKGFKLVIAGFLLKKPRELAYFETLKSLAKGLDVEFRLDLEDAEIKKLYSNSYAVLFSAMNEDLGLIPIESMACQKPCISVNEGGPTNTIVNGKTGFLMNSEAEMAEKMLFLAENPSENERMGKAGRERVLKNYTWNILLNKVEKAFKETASGRIL